MQTEANAKMALERPLIYPGLPPRDRFRQMLRLWQEPSFEPTVSWAIIECKDEWFVRRIAHFRNHAFGVTFHDTFGAEANLPASVGKSLVEQLQEIRVAPFRRVAHFGIDGTVFGIQSGDFLQHCRLSWWNKAPEDRRDLQSWHDKAIGVLEQHLPARTKLKMEQ